MTCGVCGRLRKVERLSRGWKICRSVVFCPGCRRRRFRLRSITMAVAEPTGAELGEFRSALEEMWRRATPLLLTDEARELTTVEGQHIVRVFIGDQWWALRLNDAKWSRGRREAYERIAAGEVAAGEFLLYPRPTYQGCIQNCPSRNVRPYEIECKTVAWLPREQQEDRARDQSVPSPRTSRLDPMVRKQNIQEIEIGILREAIRANWVSFPSQVPTFPNCGLPDLQPKLIQLYFVFGWKCANIAARYGLAQEQVRHILNAWRCRAGSAGYIQHILPAEVVSQGRS